MGQLRCRAASTNISSRQASGLGRDFTVVDDIGSG